MCDQNRLRNHSTQSGAMNQRVLNKSVDFSDYMWMVEEGIDDFDKKVMIMDAAFKSCVLCNGVVLAINLPKELGEFIHGHRSRLIHKYCLIS